MNAPVIAEIDIQALYDNIHAIRSRVGSSIPICAAMKANAYGHGIDVILPAIRDAGVERIAVAQPSEALQARQLGWTGPILCLGRPLLASSETERRQGAQELVAAEVSCTILTVEEAKLLSEEAIPMGRRARVQIKIDSGMGRMGILAEAADDTVAEILRVPGIIVESLYTHMASADEEESAFTQEQFRRFDALRQRLRAADIHLPTCHAANSATIFRYPHAAYDSVRPGLCLYGYWGGPDGERPSDLRPIMKVVGHLSAVRRLPAGHAVGYGCTFRTRRESVIGVVPIGYGDGYRRLLSNNAVMTLQATRGQGERNVPVVGRISMDQTTVDLTEAGDVRPGDRMTIIDSRVDATNSVEAIARKLDTIPYEITCLIGSRIPRQARFS